MSSYTSLNINVKTKSILTNQDIEKINENIKLNCGIDSCANIKNDTINLNIQFNNNLDQMIKVISIIEEYINYDNIYKIGKFSTESINKLNNSDIFVYKNHLFVIVSEIRYGFIQENYYYISDLRHNNEDYSTVVENKNFNNEDIMMLFINVFIKKYY